MARSGLRSIVVAWLRVLLPLAALVVLSMLFLVSRHSDEAPSPDAQAEAEASALEPRIGAPSWTGVTSDGARLTMAARSAALGPGGQIETARGVYLHWRASNGVAATVAAPEGRMTDDEIILEGGVAVAVSTGWKLNAPTISAATDRSHLTASGGVTSEGPFGEIESDRASLYPAGNDEAAGQLLDFTGDVRLIYRP